MEMKVTVTIHQSQTRKTFLLMAEDEIYDEVFGIADGMKSAIADFVESFNGMMFRNDDGSECNISSDDIVLPKRSEWTIKNIQTSWL